MPFNWKLVELPSVPPDEITCQVILHVSDGLLPLLSASASAAIATQNYSTNAKPSRLNLQSIILILRYLLAGRPMITGPFTVRRYIDLTTENTSSYVPILI